MKDLTSYKEIHEKYNLARTTINRRVKALNLKVFKMPHNGVGQPKNGIKSKYVHDLVDFDFNMVKTKGVYKTSEQRASHFKTSANNVTQTDNRKNSLYMTIQDFTLVCAFQGEHDRL